MSWQWIPAQIDAIPTTNAYEDSLDSLTQYRPGYYVGKDRDNGFVLTTLGLMSRWYGDQTNLSSGNGWIITDNPNISFSCSSYTSADTLLDSWTMSIQDGGSTITHIYNSSIQRVYYGKLVFNGSSYWLYYSKSQNRYIIRKPNYNEMTISEPVYSTDSLSGGISGDYFWSGPTDLDFTTSYTSQGPIGFALEGAKDQYKNNAGQDYIDHILIEPHLNYYTYSSPASLTAYDEVPAGEYTNPTTGDKKIVGTKCFKGSDNSVWRGHGVGRGRNYEYWESEEWGGYGNRLRYYLNDSQYGNCWGTVHNASSHQPYFVYPNALSVLPDSFDLQRYEWNTETSAYEHITSADISLELGPYQMLSSDGTIVMGDYAQWR